MNHYFDSTLLSVNVILGSEVIVMI